MNSKIFTLTLLSFLILIHCKKNEKPFIEASKNIALQAKAELGKNLMNAIQTKGTEGAIEFCNLKAIPITNDLSKTFNMHLKRVSDKPRNPQNNANAAELKIIETFKTQLLNNEILKPTTVETDTTYVGYFPIETNQMCLQCHGDKEKDIKKGVSLKLNSLYPTDNAIGYSENQIRGMWVVEKNKDSK